MPKCPAFPSLAMVRQLSSHSPRDKHVFIPSCVKKKWPLLLGIFIELEGWECHKAVGGYPSTALSYTLSAGGLVGRVNNYPELLGLLFQFRYNELLEFSRESKLYGDVCMRQRHHCFHSLVP